MGETGRGDVAIDTVRVSPGPCVIRPGVAALDKYTGCSFNTDMCGYLAQNVPADSSSSQAPAMWSRVKGATGRFPAGHRSQDGDEEDWYALFDVRKVSFTEPLQVNCLSLIGLSYTEPRKTLSN